MSFSVDDLVSSLNSSHIGQEAIDLAALQSQLAQILFGQSVAPAGEQAGSHRASASAQPCTTPIRRTPSSSFSLGSMSDAQRQAIWEAFRSRELKDGEDIDEDEQMVEDLLMPTSPVSPAGQTSMCYGTQQPAPCSPHLDTYTTFHSTSPPSSAPTSAGEQPQSLFTSTDPFYIAQLQAAQNYNYTKPIFPQAVFPAQQQQQSSFMIQQQPTYYIHIPQHRENHGLIH